METRTILAKVCPKCSGTIWYWNGNRFWCKACRDAWFEKNKEEIKAKYKEYYNENKEELLKKDRAWAKANKSKCTAMLKRWRKNHPEKYKAQQNRRRKKEVVLLRRRYVVERIKDNDPDISVSSITENDINKYREYLKTKRLCVKIQKELQLQD